MFYSCHIIGLGAVLNVVLFLFLPPSATSGSRPAELRKIPSGLGFVPRAPTGSEWGRSALQGPRDSVGLQEILMDLDRAAGYVCVCVCIGMYVCIYVLGNFVPKHLLCSEVTLYCMATSNTYTSR